METYKLFLSTQADVQNVADTRVCYVSHGPAESLPTQKSADLSLIGGTVAEHLDVVHVVYGHEQLGVSVAVDVSRRDSADCLNESVVYDRRQLVVPVVTALRRR
jgi:hypothetical protein